VCLWQLRAVSIPSADGKPVLLDNGVWEVAGATGSLARLGGDPARQAGDGDGAAS